jgi:hypothetical protein
MKELVDKLNQYKNVTIDLISCVESEDYDSIDRLIENREVLIKDINNLTYQKEDFERICNDLLLLSCQDKLNKLMESKMNSIKQKQKKLTLSINVNNNYTKSGYVDSLFFSKKI